VHRLPYKFDNLCQWRRWVYKGGGGAHRRVELCDTNFEVSLCLRGTMANSCETEPWHFSAATFKDKSSFFQPWASKTSPSLAPMQEQQPFVIGDLNEF
jgi:hypothetical protein